MKHVTVNFFLTSLFSLTLLVTAGYSQSDQRNPFIIEYSSRVYEAGEKDYEYYRIPSILIAGDRLYAFAEGRKHDLSDHGQIDIVLKISGDDGRNWSELMTITTFQNQSSQNPTPVFLAEENKILLLFTKRTVAADTEDQLRGGTSEGYVGAYLTSSVDNGITWSTIQEITDKVKLKSWRWYAFGPGGAIVIQKDQEHAGRIIVPANHSVDGGKGNEFLGAHVVYSDDKGRSWHIGAIDSCGIESVNPNELTVIETTTGTLYFNTRNQNDHPETVSNRAITYSRDGGNTFERKFYSEPRLITPVVHASLSRSGNKIVFVAPSDNEKRINLSLWISEDETLTWERPLLIHKGNTAYSSTIEMDNNRLGILFESGINGSYQQILFKSIKFKGS